MYLPFFLFIAAVLSLTLGEFGQFPFGQTTFSISVTDILLSASLVLLLIWNIGIKKTKTLPKNFLWLAGFWFVGLLSLLFSFNLSGIFYLIRFIIYSSVFYLVYYFSRSRILGREELFSLIKIDALILAIAGFIQLLIFPDLEFYSVFGYDPHKFRLFSTFLDPNFTGTFLNFGFLICIYELLSAKADNFKTYFKENKFNIWLSIFLFASIILTFSRSAYLMLFAGLLIMLFSLKRLLLIPLFLLPMVLYLIFPPFALRIEGGFDIDSSASERFYSWEKGLKLFQQSPVYGVGFNNIRDASESLNLNKTFSYDGGNSGAGIDSSLIFIMASAGIAGTVVLGIFASKILYQITQNFLKKKSVNALYLAIFASLWINSFFINSLFYTPILVLVFALIGNYYGLAEGEGEA